jgi:hypothetical protein
MSQILSARKTVANQPELVVIALAVDLDEIGVSVAYEELRQLLAHLRKPPLHDLGDISAQELRQLAERLFEIVARQHGSLA